MASSLDHIEKTLAEAYRKEIDAEENVWRSLPFFAATLALQLAAMFQVVDRLPRAGTGLWWDAVACILLVAVATMTALGFLATSIFLAKFSYITSELELLAYAEALDLAEQRKKSEGRTDEPNALAALKLTLARQYAVSTLHNRGINQRRFRCRSIAGLAILSSLLVTLLLVASVALHYALGGR